MIHLYHGDGKGKTTAATGLALRALGAGWRVVAVQFLKDGSSHEVRMLADLPGATVLHDAPPVKFTFQMDDAERRASRHEHDANLARALGLAGAAIAEAPVVGRTSARTPAVLPAADAPVSADAVSGAPAVATEPAMSDALTPGALLILDEALDAHAADLLDEALLRAALAWAADAPDRELVVTGHTVPAFVLDAADYVTRFHAARHPYARGLRAREGIEY